MLPTIAKVQIRPRRPPFVVLETRFHLTNFSSNSLLTGLNKFLLPFRSRWERGFLANHPLLVSFMKAGEPTPNLVGTEESLGGDGGRIFLVVIILEKLFL